MQKQKGPMKEREGESPSFLFCLLPPGKSQAKIVDKQNFNTS